MRLRAFILAATACVLSAHALSSTPQGATAEISYFGETLGHPGGAAGIAAPLAGAGPWSLGFTVKISAYIHPRNHRGILLTLGLDNALALGGSFSLDLPVAVGILWTRPDGAVYSASPSGPLIASTPGFTPKCTFSAAFGISWRDPAAGLGPFMRLGAFAEVPFNGYVYPHLFAEAGAMVRIGG